MAEVNLNQSISFSPTSDNAPPQKVDGLMVQAIKYKINNFFQKLQGSFSHVKDKSFNLYMKTVNIIDSACPELKIKQDCPYDTFINLLLLISCPIACSIFVAAVACLLLLLL